MKTDDLIASLAADAPVQRPLRRLFAAATVLGAIGAFILFMLTLGPREDMDYALRTVRFDLKCAIMLLFAVTAFLVARDMTRPEVIRSPLRPLLWAAPALLLLAVIVELVVVPQDQWMPRLVGHNMMYCTTMIPVFALVPLALMLWVFRRGAPQNPTRAGAVAGLLAGGIGATFYAMHCFDDSPLFVATWYTLAIAFIAGVGALLGSRFLRW